MNEIHHKFFVNGYPFADLRLRRKEEKDISKLSPTEKNQLRDWLRNCEEVFKKYKETIEKSL